MSECRLRRSRRNNSRIFSSVLPASDSVELKLTVPGVAAALDRASRSGMDPLEAQIRQVVLLRHAGSRARRARRRRARAAHPGQGRRLGREAAARSCRPSCRRSCALGRGFNVEVDALPGGFVCSGTMKGALDGGRRARDVRRASCRSGSSSRRSSGRSSPSTRRTGWSSTTSRCSGRSSCSSCGSRPTELERRLVAEMWLYPDGSRVLELSTKCDADDAFQVAARLRAFLADHGVELSGAQQTKTRKALEFFAAGSPDDADVATAPSPVVPRWEWRTFAGSLRLPEERRRCSRRARWSESDELYLLSRRRGRVREGARERPRREGAPACRRRRPRAVAAGTEGAPAAADGDGRDGARCARLAADALDRAPRDVEGSWDCSGGTPISAVASTRRGAASRWRAAWRS